MEIDDVYKQIGELGRHQRKLLAGLILPNAFTACHMVHLVFVGASPTHFTCHLADASRTDSCFENGCDRFSYPQSNFTSIVTEWDLLCGAEYKSGLAQSLFMSGVLLGALLFGWFADRYGRRKCLQYSLILTAVVASVAAMANSYEAYVALRTIAGIFCGGVILVSFVLATELVGSTKRALVGMIAPTLFAGGIMAFALVAYLCRNWRLLSVLIALPGLPLTAVIWWIIPESPRWLLSQGNLEDAEQVLEMIALRNSGKMRGKPILLRPLDKPSGRTYSMTDLLLHRTLCIRTLIQVYAWFVACGTYYGLTMSAGGLGSNIYISVSLSALVELPAYAFCLFFLNRVGRRHTFCIPMLIGGACCLAIMVTPPGSLLVTLLALMGKLTISAAFAVAYIYSAELYPTVVRNIGMGVCSVAGRVGGIMAPLFTSLGSVYPSLQFFVFGILALTAGALCYLLPETAKKPMPETISDLDLTSPRVTTLTEDKVRLLKGDILQKQREVYDDGFDNIISNVNCYDIENEEEVNTNDNCKNVKVHRCK